MNALKLCLNKEQSDPSSAIWEAYAYVARYGNQTYSEMKRMTLRELNRFVKELSLIVIDENKPAEPR